MISFFGPVMVGVFGGLLYLEFGLKGKKFWLFTLLLLCTMAANYADGRIGCFEGVRNVEAN